MQLIRRLFGARDGVAAVEFAFIAPILILAYFGVAELCGAMLADRKAYHAASAIGDLVTQNSAPTPANITDIFIIANAIMQPYSATGMSMRVTAIGENTAGTQATVLWSCSSGTAYSNYAIGTVIGPPTLPLNMITGGQSIVMTETQYVYNSPVRYLIPNAQTYTNVFFLRPRLVDPIPNPGNSAPCN